MVLDSSSGVLSGTPSASGTFYFRIRAVDSSTPVIGVRKLFTLVVRPDRPKITPPSRTQVGKVDVAYSYTFNATEGKAPYTWSALTTLPAGLSLSSNGVLSGTPAAAAAPQGPVLHNIRLKCAGTNGQFATVGFRLTINPADPPRITTTVLVPEAELNEEYETETPIQASGGKPPYRFAAASTMPSALVVNADGSVSGTPKLVGNLTFSVRVTGSDNKTSTARVKLVVSDAPTPKITTVSPLNGLVGSALGTVMTATGGKPPYKWKTLGTSSSPQRRLPQGLTLLENGTFSGQPEVAGEFKVAVRVTDANEKGNTKTFTFNISKGALAIKAATVAPGYVGIPYSYGFEAEGGRTPYVWSMPDRGTLPSTFKISSTGVLTGTPTAVGNHSFSVRVADASNPAATAEARFTLQVRDYDLQITTASLPDGKLGAVYTPKLLEASGGKPPYSWSFTPPVSGMTAAGGNLSGTPKDMGNFTLAVKVTDDNKKFVTRNLTFRIGDADPITANPQDLPDGQVGSAYAQTLGAKGGVAPYVFSGVANLPAGLRLIGSNLSGTPSAPGNFTFTVNVTDSKKPTKSTAKLTYKLKIAPYDLVVSGPATITGKQYTAVPSSVFTASGGKPPYRWSSTPSLPRTLSLNATNGEITGDLTDAPKSYPVSIIVTDANRISVSKNCTIVIQAPDPLAWVTTSPLPPGKVGVSYNATLEATGGKPPRSFTLKIFNVKLRGGLPPVASKVAL